MTRFVVAIILVQLCAAAFIPSIANDKGAGSSIFPLDSMDGLEVHTITLNGAKPVKTTAEVASYAGRRAARIVNDDGLTASGDPAGGETIAILQNTDFKNGTIEAEIVGLPRVGAPPDVRGFIGIAFRVQDHGAKYECIYLRQTNGRANDQLRRNHTTQYMAHPEFPWQRLRKENPGVYESYVDIEPGAWTKIKIAVSGTRALLYVNGAEQPSLIVNDLKLGETHGLIALWTGSDSDGYFSNLSVKPDAGEKSH